MSYVNPNKWTNIDKRKDEQSDISPGLLLTKCAQILSKLIKTTTILTFEL